LKVIEPVQLKLAICRRPTGRVALSGTRSRGGTSARPRREADPVFREGYFATHCVLDRVGSVCLGTIDAPPTVIDDGDFAVVSSGFSSVRGARVWV